MQKKRRTSEKQMKKKRCGFNGMPVMHHRNPRKALKMEKNAQKSRRNADQQSRRASDAREKSDNN